MFKKVILIFSFFIVHLNVISQNLEASLKLSGDNRINLEEVLNHYKNNGEKQKYQAAVFLIKNMPLHKSVSYDWYDKNNNKIEFSEFYYPDYRIAYNYLESIKDSIGVRPKKVIDLDVKNVSKELLISNIDLSFFEWKNNPWSKQYSFEVFCEYILPYRSLIEPLEDWRGNMKLFAEESKYGLKVDEDDPVEACVQIINGLEDFTFINTRPDPIPILSPSQMLFRRQASCPDLANFAVLVSRSKGIATTFDFTPHYAASSNRHFWNTVINNKGKHIPFNSNSVNECDDCLPYVYKANRKRLGKVFRNTYSLQKQSLANKIPQSYIPEAFLRQKNIKDVTSEYVSVSDLKIDNYKATDSIGYISVFNLGKWRVVDWAKKSGDKIIFKNLGQDIIYMPTIYKNKKQTYYKYPFLIDKKGVQRALVPNNSKKLSATLSRDNELKTDYIDFNTLEIISGKTYYLKYWNKGWKTIGASVSKNESVFFENIPSNALLRLIPEKPDGFERIFLLEEGTNQMIWF